MGLIDRVSQIGNEVFLFEASLNFKGVSCHCNMYLFKREKTQIVEKGFHGCDISYLMWETKKQEICGHICVHLNIVNIDMTSEIHFYTRRAHCA